MQLCVAFVLNLINYTAENAEIVRSSKCFKAFRAASELNKPFSELKKSDRWIPSNSNPLW